MPLLVVDAMNVIGSRPDGWWRDRDGAVRRFADALRAWAEATGTDALLVVDGAPIDELPEGSHGTSLGIRYAERRGPDAADDRIVAIVEELAGPCTVVTADRDLRARVRALGAELLGPRHLLDRIEGPVDT